MEEKINIIKQITKFHPGWGTDKGWSWYVGGMRDDGGWYWEKMIDASEEDLGEFLKLLTKQQEESDRKNKERLDEYERVKALSEKEQADYYNKIDRQLKTALKEHAQFIENHLLWGK